MKIYMKEGVVSRSQTVRVWLRETSRCDVLYPRSIYYNLSRVWLRETTFDNYGSDIRNFHVLYRWFTWGVASLPERKTRSLCLAHLCANTG